MPFKPAILIQRVFFWLCLAVSLATIILSSSNPTLDGPSHLYNARLATYLVSGNGFIGNYFATNPIPVPNLTDHYIMTFCCRFLSFAATEKVLQVLCVMGFPVMFRLLVKQFNPENIGLSIISIPFSFSFLYYLGFYNFLLSFPILFGVFALYIYWVAKPGAQPRIWHYGILTILTTLLYFTNGLAFLYGGLLLFIIEVIAVIKSKWGITVVKRLLFFGLIWLPGLICFVVFMLSVTVKQPEHNLAFKEKLQWLADMRPLVVYTYDDAIYTRFFSGFVLLALGAAIYFRIKDKGHFKYNMYDIFFVALLFTLVCFFVVPDGWSVGMMDTRLCHYFFVFLLLWIACQRNSKIVTWIFATGVIVVHFMLLFNVHVPVQAALNKEAESIRQGAQAIEDNSVVLDVDATNNWLLGHFGCYIGEDKPLLILPNYEPNDRWFGLVWKDYMPTVGFNGTKDADIIATEDPHETRDIDYIFIHGSFYDIVHNDDWKGLREMMHARYKPYYFSPDSNIHVYILNRK